MQIATNICELDVLIQVDSIQPQLRTFPSTFEYLLRIIYDRTFCPQRQSPFQTDVLAFNFQQSRMYISQSLGFPFPPLCICLLCPSKNLCMIVRRCKTTAAKCSDFHLLDF